MWLRWLAILEGLKETRGALGGWGASWGGEGLACLTLDDLSHRGPGLNLLCWHGGQVSGRRRRRRKCCECYCKWLLRMRGFLPNG